MSCREKQPVSEPFSCIEVRDWTYELKRAHTRRVSKIRAPDGWEKEKYLTLEKSS